MPNHQALVFAVDAYPGANRLPGAVRSAEALAVLLKARGFHVATLFDEAVTKAGIADALARAYRTVPAMGDALVIAYVGHGVRINLNGVITDCIVPHDALTAAGTVVTNLISAPQWAALLAKRPSHAHVLWIADCCYGGGDLVHPSVPHVACGVPWHVEGELAPFADVGQGIAEHTSFLPAASSSNLLGWAPCGPAQLSVEQQFKGEWFSIFTKFLVDAAAGIHTYAEIFHIVSAKCMAAYSQATPMMAGDTALAGKRFLT